MEEVFWQILMITIPALIVFATAYLMIKGFLDNQTTQKRLELRMQGQRETLPMRLQAYERLALFIERISFNNLITRVRESNMTAKELQMAIISTIRLEFEHNMSMQIYVSAELWNMVTLSKDEMIKITNLVAASMPAEATSADLSKAIFQFLMDSENVLPTQKALDALKNEVAEIL